MIGLMLINGGNSVVAMPRFLYFIGPKLVIPRDAIAIG
jgi:hypothetical protein